MPNIKDDFLAEILADLPAGIRDKLDAEIPEPPEVSIPTDTDSAILVNGICAWYVLELFRPLAGLTLVQIPMWLGHLSTVNHGRLLSSLEYNEDTDAQHDFTVVEPKAGSIFMPGDVRLQVKPTNGTLQQVAVEMGTQATALDYDEENNVFWGYLRAEDLGPYTATFTGLFDDDSTQAIDVAFSVSDDPEDEPDDPEGGDWLPVEIAKKAFDKAASVASKAAMGGSDIIESVVNTATDAANAVGKAIEKVLGDSSAYQTVQAKIQEVLDFFGSRDIPEAGLTMEELLVSISGLKSAVDTMYSADTARYLKLNPHPAGGYTSCPETLAGAREAMLEKYGPGTVIEY